MGGLAVASINALKTYAIQKKIDLDSHNALNSQVSPNFSISSKSPPIISSNYFSGTADCASWYRLKEPSEPGKLMTSI